MISHDILFYYLFSSFFIYFNERGHKSNKNFFVERIETLVSSSSSWYVIILFIKSYPWSQVSKFNFNHILSFVVSFLRSTPVYNLYVPISKWKGIQKLWDCFVFFWRNGSWWITWLSLDQVAFLISFKLNFNFVLCFPIYFLRI